MVNRSVVDDDMDGAAGPVTQAAARFSVSAIIYLPGERGVAVQHHRHHENPSGPSALTQQILLGPDQALQHRIDGLQV